MDVYVLGVAMHPAAEAVSDKRLEEMVFDTTYAALKDARIDREQIDHVTIAASDELDGRAISSMLLAMPAGAYLRDETKCTDSGLTGLCLGAMRVETGIFDLGLVVSWNKTSEAPVEDVMRMRCEPLFTRPVGLNMAIADGLFAGAVCERYGITAQMADEAASAALTRAAENSRGLRRPALTADQVAGSTFVSTPLREAHRAPLSDGAVAMVIASGAWVRARAASPKARLAGMGWRSERYELGADRLAGLAAFRGAIDGALDTAGGLRLDQVDVVELDAQTAFHHLAYREALPGVGEERLSPAGGAFAQNPYFCTGLANAAEAVLQIAGEAGPVQRANVNRALAHGSHGFAQQGHAAVVFEKA